jgi:hypothetical protein
MSRGVLVGIVVAVAALGVGFLGGLAYPARPFAAPTVTSSVTPSATPTDTASPTATASPVPTATSTATPAPTSTPTDTATPAGPPTATLRPSRTPSITPTPTFDPPEGRVLEQANCRYGPGAAYLYEWGLYPKNHVDILATNELRDWLYIHPWYFRGDCWVRADLIEVLNGDLSTLRPYYGLLPASDLYKPPSYVEAVRNGDDVIVSWNEVWMTEDDYRGYLIEAWLCVDGQIIFTPVRIDGTRWTLHDEAGCMQPSGGRVYTAEKHGYTQWRLIPWPPHPGNTTVTPSAG